MAGKPTGNNVIDKEMQKVEAQLDKFESEVKSMTLDRMNAAPKQESAPLEISQKAIEKSKDIYLKPHKSIGCKEKFNEKFRSAYEFDKQYVHFVAENKELIGDTIDLWTRPYAGMPAEEWLVPANTPVWGPRYLAEQIKRKRYHRMVMKDTTTGGDHNAQYYGTMSVDTSVQRLDAHPVSSSRSVGFMSSGVF